MFRKFQPFPKFSKEFFDYPGVFDLYDGCGKFSPRSGSFPSEILDPQPRFILISADYDTR